MGRLFCMTENVEKRFYIWVGNQKLYLVKDRSIKKGELHCNPSDFKKILGASK